MPNLVSSDCVGPGDGLSVRAGVDFVMTMALRGPKRGISTAASLVNDPLILLEKRAQCEPFLRGVWICANQSALIEGHI